MTPEAFVDELHAEIRAALDRHAERASAGEQGADVTVAQLLRIALRNELEATEEAALWLSQEEDIEVKLSLARQCGDEARHYRLIEARLAALGDDLTDFDPSGGGPSPLFRYLESLRTTVERVAAGPFTREALAQVRNEIFIDYCESVGDAETAALYRDTIQPDEGHHHSLGRKMLLTLATTAEDQERARSAARRTLEIADELQEIARLKKGLARLPGC